MLKPSHLADQLRIVANTASEIRGPTEPPGLDVSSMAHRDRRKGATLATSDIPAPFADLSLHLRLLDFACVDLLYGLADLLSQPRLTLAIIPTARSLGEAASRLWYLADHSIDGHERYRRTMQFEVRELDQSLEKLDGQSLSEIGRETHKHYEQRRRQVKSWLTHHYGQVGNSPGPTKLVASHAREQVSEATHGSYDGAPLGEISYHISSSPSHALLRGLNAAMSPVISDEEKYIFQVTPKLVSDTCDWWIRSWIHAQRIVHHYWGWGDYDRKLKPEVTAVALTLTGSE